MKKLLLLDTHTLIWLDIASTKLSSKAIELLKDSSNTLLVSVVSIWEMQIKLQLGKLQLNQNLSDMIVSQQQTNHINILPVKLSHVLALQNLPMYHKDPFDRLLIVQAQVEKAILVSCDEKLKPYSVEICW